ncbi:hypothetical protein [Ferdinandcohnia sp. Marseille-Q9671]
MKKEIGTFFSSLPPCPLPWRGSLKARTSAPDDKIYEVYIYTLIAREFMANTTWSWRVLSGKGIVVRSFIFRGKPGKLNGDPEFSFIEFNNKKSGNSYELHLGIEISGVSTVNHEIDIGLFDTNKASDVRNHKVKENINGRSVPLTIECKYYNIKIGKDLGRQTLGMAIDTERSFHLGKFLQRECGMFVSNNDDESINDLLSAYNLIYFGKLMPKNIVAVNSFKDSIKNLINNL